ncbi:DUF4407 domain-containing protein [Aquabacterium sp. A7-Y]|uniref:hypothetical protein n=1 Tax=Aquabacterium sp. A7-Y TaxID=1349605 RepID=UPI00223DB0EA|nr:hypothetical protein [Aquabacterium sp. A7-Y]MCW7542110.1 DUF4407 domain-containing protein [Aquabacterium sp. A7-Y]
MRAALQAVLEARRHRLAQAEALLRAKRQRLAELAAQIAALDDEERQIGAVIQAWETQWREWLAEQGRPMQGKSYVDHHMQLTVWLTDLREQRQEVMPQYLQAQQEEQKARREVATQTARLDRLQGLLARLEQQYRSRLSAVQEEQVQEVLAARLYAMRLLQP